MEWDVLIVEKKVDVLNTANECKQNGNRVCSSGVGSRPVKKCIHFVFVEI